MNDTNTYGSFHQAAEAVLDHLHELLGFDLWMVTRTEGEDWIVLQAADKGYGVTRGDVFRWSDSFCSRMVEGLGPRIAPCSEQVPVYAAAPIGQQVEIGAYVGVPLSWDDGRLFGTLCAIHPESRPEWIEEHLHLIELLAGLLSSILQAEIKASEQARCAERAQLEALTDSLTGLYNRRGWDELVAREEERCRRYGHPACMISIDLDGLKIVNDTEGHSRGDALIQRTAEAIKSTVRETDVAARLGGDEFSVLAVECDLLESKQLLARLQNAMSAKEVHASMGSAICRASVPFAEIWDLADEAMYVKKRSRQFMPWSRAKLIEELG